MKERLVRGTNVANVVRLLRSHQHDRPLPELGTWEQDLMRKHVSPSTWYSLQVFNSLLQVVHRYIFDGSEAAAQRMGRRVARDMMEASRETVVVEGSPASSLQRMHARWREHFNFGEIAVVELREPDGRHGVRVRLNGYPDMSSCHGHALIGWSREVAEQAGASDIVLRIEERPWMHNSVLTFTLTWP